MNEESKEVYEPEVLPPEKEPGEKRRESEDKWRSWKKSLGPIIAGLLIDAVDLATFGPLGLRNGFIMGALAVYALCAMYDLPMRKRLFYAILGGLYCFFPFTERLPLGTILGFLTRTFAA